MPRTPYETANANYSYNKLIVKKSKKTPLNDVKLDSIESRLTLNRDKIDIVTENDNQINEESVDICIDSSEPVMNNACSLTMHVCEEQTNSTPLNMNNECPKSVSKTKKFFDPISYPFKHPLLNSK